MAHFDDVHRSFGAVLAVKIRSQAEFLKQWKHLRLLRSPDFRQTQEPERRI